MIKTLNFKKAAQALNNMTYTDYYYRLMLLARSVFKWENLPNGIDEKWIEDFLYNQGHCIFFKDKNFGFVVAQANLGRPNNYNEPTEITPVFNTCAEQFEIKQLENGKDCILIRNNDVMLPTRYTINLFALRLTDIQRTIDVNIKAQKTPVIVTCSDRQKKSFQATVDQREDNQITIYGDPDLDISKITTLKTEAPIVFDKLQQHKHTIWNECMTFLGINNANMDKRERLVDDEVQANNEQIELSAEVMLKSRQTAVTAINELFNTNISVSLRSPQSVNIEVSGGVNNG